jgi:predicted DNA-binding transcriptional regulator YafY
MPKNKKALVRYRLINNCLRTYRYVTLTMLADKCFEIFDQEVATRTLEKDIKDMKDDNGLGYYAPIVYDRRRHAYYYEDASYSIDNMPLDDHDLEALSFASAMLDQYKNMEVVSTFSGAVQKIMDTVKIQRMLVKRPGKKFVGFEVQPVVQGTHHLPAIMNAILQRKVLHIIHQRFDTEEPHDHIVHPCYLKEYRNRWYVVGYQPVNRRIQSWGLERITFLEQVDDPFIEAAFDPEEFYRHILGVMVADEPPSDILIRFTLTQGKYILSQPIHESQQLASSDKSSVTVKLHLSPTYEFFSIILGYGPDAEVLEPQWLREEVAKRLSESLKRYK